ncbi:MAG TPA: neutral/alkaline non-lysosomal ceramidase N-terminal domain-containing protein [Thermoleophilaceae bacterium]
MKLRRTVVLALVAGGLLAAAAPAQGANLRAGVGRADITPRTGYYLGGWTRADRIAQGQQTRLRARALVLQRGKRKLALVSIDLFMVPGGIVQQVGEELASRGFSYKNILISASHTHSGPGGFANYPTFNTAAPSLQTTGTPASFVELFNPRPADPQLYTFLVHQFATAIRRADRNLGPATLGWGDQRLIGLTKNRSLEAHLADHGILLGYGQGKVSDDPDGYVHTIDPNVNVLRVDKLRRRHHKLVHVPVGAWSTFAAHGTVTKSSFLFYNEDHHASAMKVFEDHVRRAGHVPRKQDVVNVFGNTDEGDQSAGLDRHGPAAADYVGRVEASSMLRAWKQARRHMSRRPNLDLRWTRMCFCGRTVEGGKVADKPEVGLPFFTGSEEERGPLFDVTHEHFEGRRSPVVTDPAQGHKIGVKGVPGSIPGAVPLMAVRLGSRMIVSVPGEATKETGVRIEHSVMSLVGARGIRRVVISGLANEYMSYFTTPEEFERQHYEGGQTYWGRLSSVLLGDELARLAGRLVTGQPAQPAYAIDPTNGVKPNGPPYSSGAARGTAVGQPAAFYRRFQHATFSWQGGPQGLDRPVDRAFVVVQRRVKRRWRNVTDDLGLQMLWKVDDQGRYTAQWEIPRTARRGVYRLSIRAKRYRLDSRSFRVRRSEALTLERASTAPGRVGVRLRFPVARRDVDTTYRPVLASGGVVKFLVNGRVRKVRRKRGAVVSLRVPAGASVSVPAGGAADRYGNISPSALRLR